MVKRILLVAAAAALSATATAGESAPKIKWLGSIAVASATQVGTGKLVMIYFTSPTAAHCLKMQTVTWNDGRVIAEVAKLIAALPHENERAVEGRRYAIARLPSIVFLGPKNAYLMTVDGYRSPEAMIADIGRALKMQADYEAAAARAKANPTDGETVFKLAGLQVSRRQYMEAEKNLMAARKLDTGGEHGAAIDLCLGTVMAERNRPASARELFGGIVRNHPDASEVAPARFFLAILELKEGRREDALKSLAELVDDHKDGENPWAARAERVIRQLSRVRRK